MKVWFSGAEVAAHRKLLVGLGAEHLALNLSAYFKQRQPTTMNDTYDGFTMTLYSSEGGLDPFKVQHFIDVNGHRFESIYGLEHPTAEVIPEWGGGDINDFYTKAELAGVVGITEAVALDRQQMTFIASFARKSGVKLITASHKAEVLAMPIWDEVIVGAWIASSKFKELQVWDGSHVARYSRERRQDGLDKHRTQIERLGGNLEGIEADESAALMQISVLSWLQLAQRDNQIATTVLGGMSSALADVMSTGVAISPNAVRDRPRVRLPIIAPQEDADGTEVATDGQRLKISPKLLRSCSSCNLSKACPSFEAGASCAFEMPVTITTKDDMQRAMGMLMEMQISRVMMARFTEDLLSQNLDPSVSAEIDRFFRMAKTTKEVAESTAQVTITAKADGGVLSRLFGDRVGEANRQLAAPIDIEALSSEIVDGELVDTPGT